MHTIRFNAVVNGDQTIRPPASVKLPEGPIEVTVRPLVSPQTSDAESLETSRRWLLELAKEAEQANPDLPSDMAEHHDHYAHGKPL